MWPTRENWGGLLKGLHWTMAILFVANVISGFIKYFDLMSDKAWVWTYTWIHMPFGVAILLLVGVRLCLRFASKHPELPEDTPWHERLLANVSHSYLYMAMIVMPITGWAGFNVLNIDLKPYGIPLPRLYWDPQGKDLKSLDIAILAEEIHLVVAFGIVIILALHIAGAVKHHWHYKDRVLSAMLPFGLGKR